jgi:hypothetical protein
MPKEPINLLADVVRNDSERTCEPVVKGERAFVPLSSRLSLVALVAVRESSRSISPQQQSIDMLPGICGRNVGVAQKILIKQLQSTVESERAFEPVPSILV